MDVDKDVLGKIKRAIPFVAIAAIGGLVILRSANACAGFEAKFERAWDRKE